MRCIVLLALLPLTCAAPAKCNAGDNECSASNLHEHQGLALLQHQKTNHSETLDEVSSTGDASQEDERALLQGKQGKKKSGKCQSWCASAEHKAKDPTWSSRCTWKKCNSCDACKTSSPPPPPPPEAKCESWCQPHTTPWDGKCAWKSKACSDCAECQACPSTCLGGSGNIRVAKCLDCNCAPCDASLFQQNCGGKVAVECEVSPDKQVSPDVQTPRPTARIPSTAEECFNTCQPQCNLNTAMPGCAKANAGQCQASFGGSHKMDWNNGQCKCVCEFWGYPGVWPKVQFVKGNCPTKTSTPPEVAGCYEPYATSQKSCEMNSADSWAPRLRKLLAFEKAEKWPAGDFACDEDCWKLNKKGLFVLEGSKKARQQATPPSTISMRLYVSCNLEVQHPNCEGNPNTYMQLKVLKMNGGTLKIMWGGKEINQGNGFVTLQQSPTVEVNKLFAVQLPADMGRELVLEFRPASDNFEVEIEDLAFHVPPDMLACVEKKQTSRIEENLGGTAQLAVLPQLGASAATDGHVAAVERTRKCEIAPKEDLSKGPCINPPDEDPIFWDCDCYDKWIGVCGELSESTSSSVQQCLQGIWCCSPYVCDSWKASNCGSCCCDQPARDRCGASLVETHTAALVARAVATGTSTAISNSSVSLRTNADDTTRLKNCL